MALTWRPTVIFSSIVLCLIQMAFGLDQLSYSVREELPRETFVGNLARDISSKSDSFSGIRFDFLKDGQSREDLFRVDPVSGILATSQRIDREAMCARRPVCDLYLNVQVMASQEIKIIKVRISILDVNDNAPVFKDVVVFDSLLESSQPGTKLSLPAADDPDSPKYGIQNYELAGGEGVFALADSISPDDVQLILVSSLDREVKDTYTMSLSAVDGGDPAKSVSLEVQIRVLDVNDHSPLFVRDRYNATIQEDTPLKTIILYVDATDPDLGANGEIQYGFTNKTQQMYGDTFAIDGATGAVSVLGKLDYQRKSNYVLYVTARDHGHGSVVSLATVMIHVLDVNDHAPDIRIKTPLKDGKLTVAEDSKNNSFVGHVIVEDRDFGENGAYTCTQDSEYFILEEMYTTDYKLITAAVFDREVQDHYLITITCTDKGREPKTSSLQLTIAIDDVNDQRPTFDTKLTYAEIEEGNQTGSRVIEMSASDDDIGENAEVTYSLVNDYQGFFSIDPNTGVITCNGVIDRERISDFNLTVIARDNGTPSLSASAIVIIHVTDIDDELPVFTNDLYRFTVDENQNPGIIVGQVRAIDADAPGHNELYYYISKAPDGFNDFFDLDSSTGIIRTSGVLDREMTSSYSVVVSASSAAVKQELVENFTSRASVEIKVLDVNDNSPEFIYPSTTDHKLIVDPESIVAGEMITLISATDNDTDVNVVCEYGILASQPSDILSLNPYNGSLTIERDPGRIPEQTITIDVIAFDCGTPRLNATSRLVVVFVRASSTTLTPNAVIVVVITVITVIMVVILVVLIVHVIRKRRNRKYNWIPRVIDIKINTVTAAVESAESLEKCDEIKMNNDFIIFPGESDQPLTGDIHTDPTEKEFLPSPDVNYPEEDSGCGSATCSSNTPSGTCSIPDWTDSGLSPVISDTEGSDPGHLTPASQTSGVRMPPRVHECDGLRLFSTLNVAKELADRGQAPHPGAVPAEYPTYPVGPRSEGGKPPRQTQVRFMLPPDVSSASSESLEHVLHNEL